MITELPLLESAVATTEYCRYCLMCRHVCPVGNVTQREALTPHGWGLTIASVKRGLLEWNAETVGSLYSCADCGMCRAHCVTDQPLPDAIAAARAQVVEAGLAPIQVEVVRALLHEKQRLHGDVTGTNGMTQGVSTSTTALFVPDTFAEHAHVVGAAIQLLNAIGITPIILGGGRNSGYVPSSLGLRTEARALAEEHVREVVASGVQTVLVLTPGDLYTLRTLYPDRLGVSLPQGVEVVEVVTVLANALATGNLKLKPRESGSAFAYLDPSHTPRSGRENAAPRALLRAVAGDGGKELFWSGERAQTGGATSLQFVNPQLAERLARARLEDARAIGALSLFTEDANDAAWLNRVAPEYGIQVVNLYEELAAYLSDP